MKLSKIALGVSLGIGSLAGGLAVNAADVAMFPYVVNSPSVTTIVTVVDLGSNTTSRYEQDGTASATGQYLHWRLNYKPGTTTAGPTNDANCQTKESYLPTSEGAITVDLGSSLSSAGNGGVLFGSNPQGSRYDLARQASSNPLRGVLFVHNSDTDTADYSTTYPTVQGEAMIFDFASGAAWGYKAEVKDSLGDDNASNFSFADYSSYGLIPVTFMPLSQVTTRLMVTPVDNGGRDSSMLDKGGKNTTGWNSLSVMVGLRGTANPDDTNPPVAYDRSGMPVAGVVSNTKVTCVGSVQLKDLMTPAAQTALADGGYGFLSITPGNTWNAIVYKTEGGGAVPLNGMPTGGLFSNSMKLSTW